MFMQEGASTIVVERETAAVGRRCGEGGEAWGTSETHCSCSSVLVCVFVLFGCCCQVCAVFE